MRKRTSHQILVVTSLSASIFALTASVGARNQEPGSSDSKARKPLEETEKTDSGPVNQPGSQPNRFRDEKGGVWSDLAKPDASWKASSSAQRKQIWNLTKEEQDKILHERITSGSMMGSFYEFNNLLYAVGEPFLMTTSEELSKRHVGSVFIKDYEPTHAELFETMARQTGSTVQYDPTFMSKWIAVPQPMPLPYSLKLADGWKADDRGMYVAYAPAIQPVGMDIYMLGRYSDLSEETLKKVRDTNALNFAKHFDDAVNLQAMKSVTVAGVEALFFQTKSPKKADNQWRQWSLVKNGEAFVIVSAIDDKNASQLVPQVESMVASFGVTDPPPASVGL